MLCLDDCFATTIMPQPTEITQFIFGRPLSRMLAIDPKLTIAGFREYAHFFAAEVLELYVTGLRLAGLPEK